ncbi:hypothetical protein EVAR_35663_1 [Eumeta japonica]|uniref:Uncharacterized protein n=1 Tax=Eumeta variegata TaxID=151549 RepID=A0A4C1VF82_EUMVA|nr:hypothetical protein EVAR_35663_1 [Eumeta japonica]
MGLIKKPGVCLAFNHLKTSVRRGLSYLDSDKLASRPHDEIAKSGRIYHMAFWASAHGPVDSGAPAEIKSVKIDDMRKICWAPKRLNNSLVTTLALLVSMGGDD